MFGRHRETQCRERVSLAPGLRRILSGLGDCRPRERGVTLLHGDYSRACRQRCQYDQHHDRPSDPDSSSPVLTHVLADELILRDTPYRGRKIGDRLDEQRIT
jgi:hypothetical protein